MSKGYILACDKCKVATSEIASDSLFYQFRIYTGEPESVKEMNSFLYKHRHCKPYFTDEQDSIAETYPEDSIEEPL